MDFAPRGRTPNATRAGATRRPTQTAGTNRRAMNSAQMRATRRPAQNVRVANRPVASSAMAENRPAANAVVRTRRQISVFSDGEMIGTRTSQTVARTGTLAQGVGQRPVNARPRKRVDQRSEMQRRAQIEARRRAQAAAKQRAQAQRQMQIEAERMRAAQQAKPAAPKRPLGPEDIALNSAFDLLEMQPTMEEPELQMDEMVTLEDLARKTDADLMQQARKNGVEEIGSIEDLQSTVKEPQISRFISFEVEKRPLGESMANRLPEQDDSFEQNDLPLEGGFAGQNDTNQQEQIGSAWQAGREKEIENVAKRGENGQENQNGNKAKKLESLREKWPIKKREKGKTKEPRARVSGGQSKGNTVALVVAFALLATLGSTLFIVLYLAFFQK